MIFLTTDKRYREAVIRRKKVRLELETEERKRRRENELDSTVEKLTMDIERLDDNSNSILRLPRSGFSFWGSGETTDATATSVA